MSSLCTVTLILVSQPILNPGWDQTTAMAEIQIDENNTLEYANLDYQGTEYPETDVSAMGYLHLDYYTVDATALDFFLITMVVITEECL